MITKTVDELFIALQAVVGNTRSVIERLGNAAEKYEDEKIKSYLMGRVDGHRYNLNLLGFLADVLHSIDIGDVSRLVEFIQNYIGQLKAERELFDEVSSNSFYEEGKSDSYLYTIDELERVVRIMEYDSHE